MATYGKISELDPTQKSWDTYIEWLELDFVANGITKAEQKQAVLLTVSGPSTYKLIDIPTKTRWSHVQWNRKVGESAPHAAAIRNRTEIQISHMDSTASRECGSICGWITTVVRILQIRHDTGRHDPWPSCVWCHNSSIQRCLLAEQSLTVKQYVYHSIRPLRILWYTWLHTNRGERSTRWAQRTLVIGAEGSTYRNNVISRPAYVMPARNMET